MPEDWEARAKALEAERDEALDQVADLERNAEIVSSEFEKDCWVALRSLIERIDPQFDFNHDGDGTTAQDACDFLWEAMEGCEKRAQAAESRLALAETALRRIKDKAEFGQRGQFAIIRGIADCALSSALTAYEENTSSKDLTTGEDDA